MPLVDVTLTRRWLDAGRNPLAVPPEHMAEFAGLPDAARRGVLAWAAALEGFVRSAGRPTGGRGRADVAVAERMGVSPATVRRTWEAALAEGWRGLVDARLAGPAWQQRGPAAEALRPVTDRPAFVAHWRWLCDTFQRNSMAAHRALLHQLNDWRAGRAGSDAVPGHRLPAAVPGYDRPPANHGGTGRPYGWHYANLMRHAPPRFELAAARLGRMAAADHRRQVFASRRDLWVGSHYAFDDLWHDHFCNAFDRRQAARPLEFHGLDVYSGCKIAWGMRLRTETAEGRAEGLKEGDMRFLLAYVLGEIGYSPRGTVLVVEHGTAAIRRDLEEFLRQASGGLITVARGGIGGASAHGGQHRGAGRGNFRRKAHLESLGNLIHNEFAALPGQTGKDRDHRPEGLHGLLKSNAKLLQALNDLSPEHAALLEWEIKPFNQFQSLAGEIYGRINRRTDHALSGWDELHTYDQGLGRVRRLSPAEVWEAGRGELLRLEPAVIAAMLGPDLGRPAKVSRRMVTLRVPEISADPLRFDALTLGDRLPEGLALTAVLNPLRPDRLHVFNRSGAWLGELPTIEVPSIADEAGIRRSLGQVAHAETTLLEPLRARHAEDAARKQARDAHNAALLANAPARRRGKPAGRVEIMVDDDPRPERENSVLSLLADIPSDAPETPFTPHAWPALSAGSGHDPQTTEEAQGDDLSLLF